MMRANVVLAALAVLCLCAGVGAQRSGSTALEVRIAPEEHLNQSRIALQFHVSADGAGDVASQRATVAAWVRVLPGHRILLTAAIGPVSGPSGPLPPSAIRWSGSLVSATGGGQNAACTAGTFDGPAPQNLVTGWNRSGSLTCAVVFSLNSAAGLPPGRYSGTVELAVRTD
jgi:hypothetical protein